MKAYRFPEFDTPVFNCKDKNVAVFGGGNTAMDTVRISKRLGAKNAYIIYRRSDVEMPAREEEIHHAKEEGIEFILLSNPLEFIGDEKGWLKEVKIQKMELGEPDSSGRRRPIPIPGAEYILPIDMAVISIGNCSNPIIQKTTPDLQYNKWGNILVDEATMKTSKKGSGEKITINEKARRLCEMAGVDFAPIYKDWQPGDIVKFDVSNDKLKRAGFTFRQSFGAGLYETFKWYLDYARGIEE